jgi:hypothetical protein
MGTSAGISRSVLRCVVVMVMRRVGMVLLLHLLYLVLLFYLSKSIALAKARGSVKRDSSEIDF